MLFGLCYHQLNRFKENTEKSREAASARWIIAENLFSLAAAAAVRSGIRKEVMDSMVKLIDEVHEHLSKEA